MNRIKKNPPRVKGKDGCARSYKDIFTENDTRWEKRMGKKK